MAKDPMENTLHPLYRSAKGPRLELGFKDSKSVILPINYPSIGWYIQIGLSLGDGYENKPMDDKR